MDAEDVSFSERMVVKWGGWRDFRVGKDTPRRVPPLSENETWILIELRVQGELILKITVLELLNFSSLF